MDQSDLPDVVESVKRGGRRSKRQTKSKNNSFPDEAPPYIEEKIAGSKSSQTIKYVRNASSLTTSHPFHPVVHQTTARMAQFPAFTMKRQVHPVPALLVT